MSSSSPFDVPVAPAKEPVWDILLAIAAGGAVGGGARYLVNVIVPPGERGFPWSTFWENTIGSFAMDVLIVFLLDVWPPNRYLRPFLAVGVLGGFTTFSTYTSDIHGLLEDGNAPVALLYLFASVAVCLVAVAAGMALARALTKEKAA